MNNPTNQKQDEQAQRIAYLVAGFIQHTLTRREHEELDAWVEASDENMKLFEDLTDENNLRANLEWMRKIDTEKKLREVKEQLSFHNGAKKRKLPVYSLLAAAVVILLIATSTFLFFNQDHRIPPAPSTANTEPIMPAVNATTLTLSNGKTIRLDSQGAGNVAAESGVGLSMNEQQVLSYDSESSATTSLHTLTTSKGGMFHTVLSDGTHVWLNAGSAVTYPASFGNRDREVMLSGEAYFEVTKNGHKFTVQLANGESIEVLGTQFNVNAYPDEPARSITLVEGSVKVTNQKGSLLLKPGQKCLVQNGLPQLAAVSTMHEDLAWKNNQFAFRDASISTIMRQLQRWYDIKVVYRKTPPELFNATISKNEPLSKILHLLELTGKIRFKTENNTIYVL